MRKLYDLEAGRLKCRCLIRKWKFCHRMKELTGGRVTPRLLKCEAEEDKDDGVKREGGKDVGMRDGMRMDAERDEGGTVEESVAVAVSGGNVVVSGTENEAVAVAGGGEVDVVLAGGGGDEVGEGEVGLAERMDVDEGVGPSGSVTVGVRREMWETGAEGGKGIVKGDTLLDLGFTREVMKVHKEVFSKVKGSRKRKHRENDKVPKSIGVINKNDLRKYLVPRRLVSAKL